MGEPTEFCYTMSEVKALANYKKQCEIWKMNYTIAETGYLAQIQKSEEENIWKDKTVFGTSVAASLLVGIIIGVSIKQ